MAKNSKKDKKKRKDTVLTEEEKEYAAKIKLRQLENEQLQLKILNGEDEHRMDKVKHLKWLLESYSVDPNGTLPGSETSYVQTIQGKDRVEIQKMIMSIVRKIS